MRGLGGQNSKFGTIRHAETKKGKKMNRSFLRRDPVNRFFCSVRFTRYWKESYGWNWREKREIKFALIRLNTADLEVTSTKFKNYYVSVDSCAFSTRYHKVSLFRKLMTSRKIQTLYRLYICLTFRRTHKMM